MLDENLSSLPVCLLLEVKNVMKHQHINIIPIGPLCYVAVDASISE